MVKIASDGNAAMAEMLCSGWRGRVPVAMASDRELG